jgi:uncharacterized membrane protein
MVVDARMEEMKKPTQKTFAGMPMNWDWKNWHKGLWNPESDELFTPKRVGIGWTINFHAVLKAFKILR